MPASRIAVDGVFFQLYDTGIGRLWVELLERWVDTEFGKRLVLLDRDKTMPTVSGLVYADIPAYNLDDPEGERKKLQEYCDAIEAEAFISTYYTTPTRTPSGLIVYDMIPEVLGFDLNATIWQEKHHAIRYASRITCISKNTASDLTARFPSINKNNICVASPGVNKHFYPIPEGERYAFRKANNLSHEYYLFIGAREGYKNARDLMHAFKMLPDYRNKTLIFTGRRPFSNEERALLHDVDIRLAWLENDTELRRLYNSALAVVAPSRYEGFGMPLIEAMACGCPVIASDNPAHMEVAGDVCISFPTGDLDALAWSMRKVSTLTTRKELVEKGLTRSREFSWQKMADAIAQMMGSL